MTSRTGNITTRDGATIKYWAEGDKDLPWLIFCNSLATTHVMWSYEVAAFRSEYRILRFDGRGHGQSRDGESHWSFELLASDVIQLMDEVHIDHAFVGLSLGGMIGLTIALEYPERIDALICCNARAAATPEYRTLWQQNAALVKRSGMEITVDRALQRWFTPQWLQNPVNVEIRNVARQMMLETSPAAYCRAAECLQQLDIAPYLHLMEVPVLYIAGKHDPASPSAVMANMASRTPGSAFVLLEDVAHMSNLGDPVNFQRIVESWLAGQQP